MRTLTTVVAVPVAVVGLGACGSADPGATVQGEVDRFEVGVGAGLRPGQRIGFTIDDDVATPEFPEAVSGGFPGDVGARELCVDGD